jgi:hypothetical protein
VPVTVTDVALLAETVNVLEVPAVIEAGIAVTVTVGFRASGGVWDGGAVETDEHPASPNNTVRTEANFAELTRKEGCARIFIDMFPSQYASRARGQVQLLETVPKGKNLPSTFEVFRRRADNA